MSNNPILKEIKQLLQPTEPKKLGKYEAIWEELKKVQTNPNHWVVVNVQNTDMIQTIINMVQLTKSRAQTTRRGLGLPQFGKLVIRREPEKLRVLFQLKNSGDAL